MFISLKTIGAAAVLAVLLPLETWMPFFPGRRGRLRHGLRNLGMALINALIVTAPSAGLTAGVVAFAGKSGWGFANLLPAGRWATAIAAFLLFDCWMYFWHRANHRVSFLWRFHRAHHSDTEMDATTALRFHPGEIALSTAARLPVFLILGRGFELLEHLLLWGPPFRELPVSGRR